MPPVVQSHAARKLGLHQSLFDLLDHESATISLNIQYRMNKVIAALANHLTYKVYRKRGDNELFITLVPKVLL